MDKQKEPTMLFETYAQEHGLNQYDIQVDTEQENRSAILVTLECGRTDHNLAIPFPLVRGYIDMNFSKYKYFSKYLGIVSYQDGYIEAETAFIEERLRGPNLHRLFGRPQGSTPEDYEPQPIIFGDKAGEELFITIGPATDEFRLLIGANTNYGGPQSFRYLRGLVDEEFRPFTILSIKFNNLEVNNFSTAQRLLKSLSDSCFFYLSREFGLGLQLRPSEKRRRYSRFQRPQETLPTPQSAYPPEAISFYRYGLSADNMPLLQFLAFYQVVEFFFAHYSMFEVQTLTTNHLKDPKFSPHDASMVQNIIHLIKDHKASDKTRNERQQLRAVLEATIHQTDIIDWIEEEDDRVTFFQTRELFTTTSAQQINIRKPDEIIHQLMERMYDIRCKIVHTKSTGTERDFILPYSEEALQLSYDIDLMKEVAERVLIASSSEFSL